MDWVQMNPHAPPWQHHCVEHTAVLQFLPNVLLYYCPCSSQPLTFSYINCFKFCINCDNIIISDFIELLLLVYYTAITHDYNLTTVEISSLLNKFSLESVSLSTLLCQLVDVDRVPSHITAYHY